MSARELNRLVRIAMQQTGCERAYRQICARLNRTRAGILRKSR